MNDDKAWRDYTERFREAVFPKITSSEICLSIYSGDGHDFDVKQATELGAMLLLDKPLLLVCTRGSKLPTRLARAADAVVTDWDPTSTESQERLTDAINHLVTANDS